MRAEGVLTWRRRLRVSEATSVVGRLAHLVLVGVLVVVHAHHDNLALDVAALELDDGVVEVDDRLVDGAGAVVL